MTLLKNLTSSTISIRILKIMVYLNNYVASIKFALNIVALGNLEMVNK